MTAGARTALTPLEIASGIVFDAQPPRPRPLPAADLSAHDALERAVLPALKRPPCLVSFSGGRDSSLVLAAATRAARRSGLPLPIPVTNRFPTAAHAGETEWQEQVVRHLGLTEWLRLEFTDELDAIGPYAQRLLRAHGLLWPSNVHFHLPLIDAARGGSLLTGAGGDELFEAACRTRVGAVLARAVRPQPRDAARLLLAYAPRPARRLVLIRREPTELPWLRPAAQQAITTLAAAEAAAEPPSLRGRMSFWLHLRYLRVGRDGLAAAAADGDVAIDHPLCAPELWSAVASAAPAHGFADRSAAMQALFADWLPATVLARRDKATFSEAFWNRHSRGFAREWNGCGIPADLVDVDALREHWREEPPAMPSMTLLQAAWLAHLPRRTASRQQRNAPVL